MDLKAFFADKPECVLDIPEAMLPLRTREALGGAKRPALVEIAGRDSIAAAIAAAREEGLTDLLPVYAYTGTEWGPWETVPRAVRHLHGQLPETRVHDLVLLGSPRLWQALNGRFVTQLIRRYGFYTPCAGCHLYLHGIRIPLALKLGLTTIVSGEREHHDGDVKVNQSAGMITAYTSLAARFGVRLLTPLRGIDRGEDVERLLDAPWKEGKEQLGCVLSGNYRDESGHPLIAEAEAFRYLEDFALPVVERVCSAHLQGASPDPLAIAAACLPRP